MVPHDAGEGTEAVELLTATEAAQILEVTRQTVHRWIADGTFDPVYKIGARPTYVLLRSNVEHVKQLMRARG